MTANAAMLVDLALKLNTEGFKPTRSAAPDRYVWFVKATAVKHKEYVLSVTERVEIEINPNGRILGLSHTLVFAADEDILLNDGSPAPALSFAMITCQPLTPSTLIGMIGNARMRDFEVFSMPTLLRTHSNLQVRTASESVNFGIANLSRQLDVFRSQTREVLDRMRAEKINARRVNDKSRSSPKGGKARGR